MEYQQTGTQSPPEMSPARLEAFSDGVLAVIITIMVLELHAPLGASLDALKSLVPGLLIYVLSFTLIGIYWNNHHHLLRATRRISGGVMWANLHLLFWLSLVPLVTAWVGEHPRSRGPAVAYGAVGFLAGLAYYILTRAILAVNQDTRIQEQLGRDVKGKLSMALYALAIAFALAFRERVGPLLAFGTIALVAIMWFIPDRRLAPADDRKE
jgi:uncharacterized membrane protein